MPISMDFTLRYKRPQNTRAALGDLGQPRGFGNNLHWVQGKSCALVRENPPRPDPQTLAMLPQFTYVENRDNKNT